MSQRELLAKRIGLVGITNLLVELNSVILLPVLTNNLSISEYGMWAEVMVTIGLIPAIALFGLPYSMVRFLAPINDEDEIREIFYDIAFIIAISGLVASLFIFALAEPIANILFEGEIYVVRMLSLIVFVECLTSIPLTYFRTIQQIKKYSVFILARVILRMMLVITFVLLGWGIYGAELGLLISSTAVFICMAIFVIRDIGIIRPGFRNLREYFDFGMPTVPGNLSSWIVNSSDRYVIGLLLGTAAVGYYSPGYSLGSIIYVLIVPVSFMLPVVLSKHFEKHEHQEVDALLGLSMKYFLVLAIPSAFGLSLLSKPILMELTTPEIALQGYQVTPFIAFSSIFFGAYAVVAQVIILHKKTMLTGGTWLVAAFLNLGLNFLLVPYIGILGAAITALLAFCFAFFVTKHYAGKYIELHFDLVFMVKSILASSIMSILIISLNPMSISGLLFTVSLAALLYFLVMFFLKGITKAEIQFLRSLLQI